MNRMITVLYLGMVWQLCHWSLKFVIMIFS